MFRNSNYQTSNKVVCNLTKMKVIIKFIQFSVNFCKWQQTVNFCKYLMILFSINCCFAVENNLNFLVISDIHLNNHTKHRMDLSPKITSLRNDLDLMTYLSFIKLGKKSINTGLINKPNFILLLGDLQGHKRYQNDVTVSQAIIFKSVFETFTNIPVIYIFGNNDSPEKNYGKFQFNNISPFTIANNTLTWKNGFLSTGTICQAKPIYPCLISQKQKYGYFTIKLSYKLKLIGLNSVLFSIHNNYIKDANDEIIWFRRQLEIAKKNNEQILIAMHIPPGYDTFSRQDFWRKDEFNKFSAITDEYSDIIIGVLTGHTHKENKKILITKLETYVNPALSTAYGNPPLIKDFLISKKAEKWHISNDITHRFVLQNNALVLANIKLH